MESTVSVFINNLSYFDCKGIYTERFLNKVNTEEGAQIWYACNSITAI